MASHDELRKQVESLRQVNTSLHREILDNNAQLTRLHENTTNLARFSNSSTPRSGSVHSAGSGHSGSNSSSPKVTRQSQSLVGGAPGNSRSQSDSGGSSPKVNRHQENATHLQNNTSFHGQSNQLLQHQVATSFQSQNPTNQGFQSQRGVTNTTSAAISHLSRLQDSPAYQGNMADNSTLEAGPNGDMNNAYGNESMVGERMAILGRAFITQLYFYY